MKIAFTSDDGKTIAAHFGHCECFLVLDVEGGKVKNREIRRPSGGKQEAADKRGHGECHCHGGSGSGHQDRLDMLSDCAAVVTLGMGSRAVAAFQTIGVEAIILSEPISPENAALAYATGGLRSKQESGTGCCRHE